MGVHSDVNSTHGNKPSNGMEDGVMEASIIS